MVGNRIGTSAFSADVSFEQILIEVWRQALVENADVVVLNTVHFPVRRTAKRLLRQVDFVFKRD